MAISFDAIFGTGALLGHLAALLLAMAAFARRPRWFKVLLLSAGVAWIFQALFVTGDGATLIWGLALAGAAGFQLARFTARERAIRFNDEEQAFAARMLDGLGRAEARHLIDQGFWLSAKPGDRLTSAGEPVSHLYYLSSGSAGVISAGRNIADIAPASFIGEVTVFTGEPATVTVDIDAPSRLWCVPAAVLRRYAEENDDIRRVLEAAFRRSLSDKLVASNKRASAAG